MPQDRGPDTAPVPAQPEPGGWVLGGRYRIVDRIGRGGMAEVFRAHDELLDRDVAVKVFRTAMDDDDDTHGEVRRELELQSLAQLSHPNLITLFDGSVAGQGPAYLVLELVHGEDLARRLRNGPLPEPEAREIGAQLADALAYVHARGMVHRDVKPANILLGVDDALPGTVRARLSDFGIVRMIGNARMTAVDMTLGTASYVAPEQARGVDVGPPADVYSLALVLIEALTGVRCFDGPVHEALAARLVSPPVIPTGLPAQWPQLLVAMTQQDPAARPSASEVAAALREGVAPAVVAAPVTLLPPVPLPASATAATAAVPAAATPGGLAAAATAASMPAAASSAGWADDPVWSVTPADGDARRGRRTAALVLSGLAVAAVLVGAGFLLLRPSSNTPADSPPTTVQTGSSGAASSTGSHSTVSRAAEVHVHSSTRSSLHPSHSKSTAAKSTPAKRTTPASHTPSPTGTTTTSSSAAPSSSPASSSAPPSSGSGQTGAIGPPSAP